MFIIFVLKVFFSAPNFYNDNYKTIYCVIIVLKYVISLGFWLKGLMNQFQYYK